MEAFKGEGFGKKKKRKKNGRLALKKRRKFRDASRRPEGGRKALKKKGKDTREKGCEKKEFGRGMFAKKARRR